METELYSVEKENPWCAMEQETAAKHCQMFGLAEMTMSPNPMVPQVLYCDKCFALCKK